MNQYIKLTIWYFFLKIFRGYCPHSWLLEDPGPAFLPKTRLLNTIIDVNLSYKLPNVDLCLKLMCFYPLTHALIEYLGLLLFPNGSC